MSAHNPKGRDARRGSALLVSLFLMVIAVGIAYSATSIATVDRHDVASELRSVQGAGLAEAGVHRAVAFMKESLGLDPFQPIAELDRICFTNGDTAQPKTYVVAQDEALVRNGRTYGTFSVTLDATVSGTYQRDITITSTGYVPNAAAPEQKSTLQAVVRVGLQTGQVFDYSYFINNWGWFYGDTINAYGNVRSNGQFDAANYAPGVFGTPRYDSIDMSDPAHPHLLGYEDDNGDGIKDGTDGGVYAGWNIVNVNRVRGMGGLPQDQHDYVAQVPMPNLSDLTAYETLAKGANSSLKLGATTISNAVLGDESGEMQNVVLIGTAANPIVLNGPVVVRGDVIIKGVVTGQGSIYAGGNIYVADNLTYQNRPTTLVPANTTQAATESWIAANQGKDFLGLFARKHLVLGDYTNWIWRYYVGSWLADPMNSSVEDAGSDGIPSTRWGRDGVPGTEDDDVLEGDGIWTVDHYTQAQADLGLLPPGKHVGDVIPGSGEDIDGNGVFNPTITLSEFDPMSSLTSGQWAGNLPNGTTNFSQISSTTITEIDGALYTNHAAAMTTLAWGQPFTFFGSIISRNESLVYGTSTMDMYYDRRLSGGGSFPNLLPKTLAPLQFLAWTRIDSDVKAHIEATQ